jgi:O-antigen/teichoic acid export membrane protein
MTSYQRAMVLVTASSLLVPVVGLVTAPILTHSLGVAGRGEAGAAIAPNLLIVGGATLGLPQALTFHLAKRPHLTRAALQWAALFTLLLGGVTLVGVVLAAPYLARKDAGLTHLMVMGALLAVPALVVGLLRGAATGRQMWRAVALERAVTSLLRLVLLGGLALLGRLDVAAAVMVMCIAPVAAGVVYLGLAQRPPAAADAISTDRPLVKDLLRFGWKVWLGSLAVILTARSSQVLVTPLSDVEQLGLLIVAITISDIPYIVTQTVRDVVFGANSADSDRDRLLVTSRIATLVALAGSALLGITLPLWISPVFGTGFAAAVVPTWLLLVASCAAVPGLIAGAGLDSAGRPALRSVSVTIGLLTNLVGLLTLVPVLGAVGAGLATLFSTVLGAAFAIAAAGRVLTTSPAHFFVPRHSDINLLRSVAARAMRRVLPDRQDLP